MSLRSSTGAVAGSMLLSHLITNHVDQSSAHRHSGRVVRARPVRDPRVRKAWLAAITATEPTSDGTGAHGSFVGGYDEPVTWVAKFNTEGPSTPVPRLGRNVWGTWSSESAGADDLPMHGGL